MGLYAQRWYSGPGQLSEVRLVPGSETRCPGLVDELYGRNDVWVFYDAMWRLHIVDYQSGDNFNNVLLRIAAMLTLAFMLSGLMLCCFVAPRAWARV